MITKVTIWGNSLAVRIPKYIAQELNLKDNTELRLFIKRRGITLAPFHKKRYHIEELSSRITVKNRHKEYFSDNSVGVEVW